MWGLFLFIVIIAAIAYFFKTTFEQRPEEHKTTPEIKKTNVSEIDELDEFINSIDEIDKDDHSSADVQIEQRSEAVRNPLNISFSVTTSEDSGEIESGDRYNDPDVKIIRYEIRSSVEQNKVAISTLQGLARIDGQTSEAERTLIFDFLNRQGAMLNENHRAWFYTSRSGEWYRAPEDIIIDELMGNLRSYPAAYRLDVLATAMAIVASGGKPKKREAEMLEKIRVACA